MTPLIQQLFSIHLQEEFESLQHLVADNNLMKDVHGLGHLSQLEVLSMNANRIADQCSFKLKPRKAHAFDQQQNSDQENRGDKNYSQNLLSDASLNSLCDARNTEMFPYLQVLQLGDNQITSIASLELGNLPSLKSLFLHHNEISKLDGLNSLSSLKELVLDGNRIKYIDPSAFIGLTQLQELHIEENGLRSLANMHPLISLNSLQVGMNRITDVANLDKLSSLTNLMEISLSNNPVCRKQVYRAIILAKCPTLISIDDDRVTLEEKEYVNSLLLTNSGGAPFSVDSAGIQRRLCAPDLQSGHGSKVPVRMTALNFESFLIHGAQGRPQLSVGAASPVPGFPPSIPAANLGTPRFGLEGVGFRDCQIQAQPGSRKVQKTDTRDSAYKSQKDISTSERRSRLIHRMYY